MGWGQRRGWRDYGLATLLLAVTVAVLLRFRAEPNLTVVALCLVLCVVLSGALIGRGPALLVSVLAGLAFNFFFIEPYLTFRIHRAEDLAAFFVFVVTAIVVGQLSTHLERRARQVESTRQELARSQENMSAKSVEAEELRKSEQLKSALLDAVTHDLRTPLTGIKAAVSTVRRDNVSEEARQELFEVIEQEADRLNHFIQGMMDLAQLEAGSVVLEQRPVTADEIVEDALDRAEPLVVHHHVEVAIEPDMPSMMVDPRLISQVLYTLLENAAKYSPAGTHLRVTARRERSDAACFLVEDEGPGVPHELRDKVFQKFFRAAGGNGYGVGLAVAKGIIQAHNGRIWIAETATGVGTAVGFQIPLGLAA